MVGNLRRRSMLTEPLSASSEWDFQWDYTKGLMSNNGFIPTLSGGTESLVDGAVKLYSGGSGNTYIKMQAPIGTCENGIAEFVLKVDDYIDRGNGFRLMLSNGTEGCQIYIGLNGVMTYNNGSGSPSIYNRIELNTEYKIRIEFKKDGKNYVYLDDNKIYESNVMSELYATSNSIFSQGQYGSVLMISAKYKFNCF